jgi:hypothetical protein
MANEPHVRPLAVIFARRQDVRREEDSPGLLAPPGQDRWVARDP